MQNEEICWTHDGHTCAVGMCRTGRGPTVILLPALSSISSRAEMEPIQSQLSDTFTTVAIDWPGFGTLPKPAVDWRPLIYDVFLDHLLTQIVPDACAVIAAGHAAGYVLRHLARDSTSQVKVVLLSPTWRGPLPTMVGRRWRIFSRMGRGFDHPLWGQILYRMNVNRLVIGLMARGHVYADKHWLDARRMAQKLAVTQARGARFSSARFVTGCLDPFESREEQLMFAKRVAVPVLMLYSGVAPKRSRLEMEALRDALPKGSTVRVAQGKLSFYEEFPEQAIGAIRVFLGESNSEKVDVDAVTEG